jgi:hypothetical protein
MVGQAGEFSDEHPAAWPLRAGTHGGVPLWRSGRCLKEQAYDRELGFRGAVSHGALDTINVYYAVSENRPNSAGVVLCIAISDHCLCVSNPRCRRTSWKVAKLVSSWPVGYTSITSL